VNWREIIRQRRDYPASAEGTEMALPRTGARVRKVRLERGEMVVSEKVA